MTAPQREILAILFADISGSTALYEQLGEQTARQLITGCLSMLAAQAKRHQGTLKKVIGDEIMFTFPSAADALEAACTMQAAINHHQHDTGYPLYIRIGFHCGDVIDAGGEISGEALHVAARIASITRARQILTTRSAVDAMPPELRSKTRQILRKGMLGTDEAYDVFQVIWELGDAAYTRIGHAKFRKPGAARNELMLLYSRKITTVNERCNSVLVGREDTCDIVVDHHLASRQHARIEFIFNKFAIVDLSSNGTFVRFSNGQEIQLEHEQIVLHGSGTISPGVPYSDSPTELIEFIVQ